MESYWKRKVAEDKYGKQTNVNSFNDGVLEKHKNDNYVKRIDYITDEEGLKQAYGSRDGLH